MMLDRGYPVEFCEVITQNLNTDFTAGRMDRLFVTLSDTSHGGDRR